MTKKTLKVFLSYSTAVCVGGNEVLVCLNGGKKGKFRRYIIGGNNAGMHMLDEIVKSPKYKVETSVDVLMPNISFKIRRK